MTSPSTLVFPVLAGERPEITASAGLRMSARHPARVERMPPGLLVPVLRISQLFGTAFPIGGGWFLTAGHVVAAAAEHQAIAIGELSQADIWVGVEVTDREILACDAGILKANLRAGSAPWVRKRKAMLEDIVSMGFGHGYDEAEGFIGSRGFKGHIAGVVESLRWHERPTCYELSFAAPRGLSGAPVWTAGRSGGVVAMIVGNSSKEIVVFREREILAEGRERTLEKVEALQLGYALSASSLLELRSDRLHSTLGEHLKRHGLLSGERRSRR